MDAGTVALGALGYLQIALAELRRIPFDSLTLAAVVHEAQSLVGGKVQRIVQPDPLTVVLSVYSGGAERNFLLSCDPEFARAHLVSLSPRTGAEPPGFCASLRAHIQGARLANVRQIGFDRILELEFEGGTGVRTLIAELMGKHANLILVDDSGKVLSAAKWVGQSKSSRPITPNRMYKRPPFPPREPIFDEPRERWKDAEGVSSFLLALLEARGDADAA
jgi:predicted ribosome quality control (RQC) complex YloA/Tae2 family protein